MTREDINDIINAICPNDEDYEKPCISPKYLRQELEQLALDQRQWNGEPTTKNCESCRYYGSHHEVCNYCYKCSLWTEVEPTTKNDLGVEEVTALAEWTEKLTKASEDAYNKGYADGVKSVNICPHCGEYIGEEE